MDDIEGSSRKRVLIGACSVICSRTHQIDVPNSITCWDRRANARAAVRRRASTMSIDSAVILILLKVMISAISVSAADAEVPLLRKDIHSSSSQRNQRLLNQDAGILAESYTGQCFASSNAYCQDNPDYYSWKGLPCSFHAELISTGADETCFNEWLVGNGSWFGKTYDQNQIFELVWECPCACNVQCHEDDKQEYEEDEIPPSFNWNTPDDTDTAPPTPAPSDHSFTTGGFGEVGVPAEALNRPEDEVDTLSVITPAASAEESYLSSSPQSDGVGILSLSNAFVLIAIIAGGCVVVAVVYISVFSLIRDGRKVIKDDNVIPVTSERTGTIADAPRKSGSRLSKAASKHIGEEEDIWNVIEDESGSSILDVSSISHSIHSNDNDDEESSLDTYERYIRYRSWMGWH